jgi:hypothetical protein
MVAAERAGARLADNPTEAMKTHLVRLAILGVAFLVVSTTAACQNSYAGLPPRFYVSTEQEARVLAWPESVRVSGSGSMRPYIPASADPNAVVAVAAVEQPPYENLKKGDLVVFRWGDSYVIHQAAARLGKYWITSGLHNARYDGPRLSRESYHSRVVRVYIIDPTTATRGLTASAQ